MNVAGSPFREATGPCALCQRDTKTKELESLARLDVCLRCRAGELDEALRVHRFREDVHVFDPQKHSSSVKEYGFKIGFTIPESLELDARLRPEPTNWFMKLFRQPDPEVGFEEFDACVRIEVEPSHEHVLMGILESAGARAAALRLLGMGCFAVGFTNSHVSTVVTKWDPGSVPPLEDVKVLLMILAVHVRAVVRSPGGADADPGRTREDGP